MTSSSAMSLMLVSVEFVCVFFVPEVPVRFLGSSSNSLPIGDGAGEAELSKMYTLLLASPPLLLSPISLSGSTLAGSCKPGTSGKRSRLDQLVDW